MYNTVRWVIVAPLSVLLGWGLNALHVPASWILGAIIASAAMALTTGQELPLAKPFHAVGRGFIGMMAALPLVGADWIEVLKLLPAGLVVASVTIGIGVTGGFILHRVQPAVSRESGILSMLAGGASVMPAIAHDIGADMRFVALAQYLRLLTVSMTLPLVASLLDTPGTTAATQPNDGHILAVTLVALLGGPIAEKLRIPVPGVFGPLILTVILSTWIDLNPPLILQIFAFMCIGWMCGGALSVPALKVFAKTLPATVTFIVVVMAACAAVAWPLSAVIDITYFEAYLATSPGALETVLALTAEGGAGPEVVIIQLIRLIAVLLVAGLLPRLLNRS